jgi:hypothetical protein
MTTAPLLARAAVKARQHASRARGDLVRVATQLVPAAGRLSEEQELAALALTWNRLGRPGPITAHHHLATAGVRH